MANEPRPYMNPRNRLLMLLRPTNLEDPSFAHYVPAPWDCICMVLSQGRSVPCICDKRPKSPPPGRIPEAKASLHGLVAGLNLALEQAGQPQLQLVEAKRKG